MEKKSSYILAVVAALSLIFMPCAAYASAQLSCNADGTVVPDTQLYSASKADKTGYCRDFDSGEIIKHMFSEIICEFVMILDDILGKVYCGIQFALKDTLKILLSVYVAVFGAQLLMGTAQLATKDILVRLLKIACVWAFATESAWGVGFIFTFFMSFINDASMWVINSLQGLADNIAGCPLGAVTQAEQEMPLYSFLDCLIYTAVGAPILANPETSTNTKVISFFMAMMVIFPPMYMLATWWAWTTFVTLVRAVLSFLMCLAAIAFLIALTPVFMSMMLFQATNHFFENWLRYMISYSLQIVLIFAIIVLWVLVLYKSMAFFGELANLVFPTYSAEYSGTMVKESGTWGICPPTFGEDPDTFAPTATCQKSGFDATPPPVICPPLCEDSPCACDPANPNWAEDQEDLIPPTAIITDGEFLYYVFYHLISLLIITYAFSILMESAPSIATAIAGPSPLPALLNGWGKSGFGAAGGGQLPGMLRQGGLGSASQDAARSIRDGMIGRR